MGKISPLWVSAAAASAWFALHRRDDQSSVVIAASVDEPMQRERAILLHKYELVQTGFLAVMNEFWQTNAFFTAFAGLAVGGIVTSWDDYARADAAMTIPLTTLVVVLMVVWLISVMRHNEHTARLARQAVALQAHIQKLEGGAVGAPDSIELFADVWTNRRHRRPRLSRAWVLVPILFVATFVGLQLAAVV